MSYDGNTVIGVQQLDDNNEPRLDGFHRTFEYDTQGKLVRIDEYIGEDLTRYFLFEYSTDQIIQKEHFIPGDDDEESVDYTVTYTLNSNEKVIKLDHESWNLSEPFSQSYEYENGNVIKITTTSESSASNSVQELEFDEYLNPNSLTGFELGLGDNIFSSSTQNKNNVIKSTLIRSGMSPIVNTYTYTYNSNRFPVERFINGAAVAEWFYDFECK